MDSGKSVAAFKCGPDYIDPLFHERVLGVPSKNLDLYFTDEKTTRGLFLAENESQISVVEGVMGLYDGLGGIEERASAYHLAKVLQTPIILVIDVHGMGRSVLAEVKGFLAMDTGHLIQGLILNRCSVNFYEQLKGMIEKEVGLAVLGYFPVRKDLQFQSRHLGLQLPDEIRDLPRGLRTDCRSDERDDRSGDVTGNRRTSRWSGGRENRTYLHGRTRYCYSKSKDRGCPRRGVCFLLCRQPAFVRSRGCRTLLFFSNG